MLNIISSPNGMAHDNESVVYGQFELGWAIFDLWPMAQIQWDHTDAT